MERSTLWFSGKKHTILTALLLKLLVDSSRVLQVVPIVRFDVAQVKVIAWRQGY